MLCDTLILILILTLPLVTVAVVVVLVVGCPALLFPNERGDEVFEPGRRRIGGDTWL